MKQAEAALGQTKTSRASATERSHLTDPDSPASCLPRLLRQLGWSGRRAEIEGALPYFSDTLTVTDVRNALVRLGYKTYARDLKLNEIHPSQFPCLIQYSGESSLRLLLSREGDDIVGLANLSGWGPSEAERDRVGRVYFVEKADPQELAKAHSGNGWFWRVVARLKKSLIYLAVAAALSNVSAVGLPLAIMAIYDRVIGAGSLAGLPFFAGGALLILLFEAGLRFMRARMLANIAGRIDYLLGIETFRQILSLPMAYTERAAVSTQMSRLREFESIRDFFSGTGANAVVDLPFVGIMIIAVALIAGPLAIVPLAAVIAFAVMGVGMALAKKLDPSAGSNASNERQNFLIETLIRMRTIKSTASETVVRDRLKLASARVAQTQLTYQNGQAFAEAASSAITNLSALVILIVGANLAMAGDLTVGALIATMMLVWRILGPIQGAFMAYSSFSRVLKSISQINRLFAISPEKATETSKVLKSRINGGIEIDRLSFRYPNTVDPALMGVTFGAKPGQIVAVMGANGSGKSTLLKLLSGLYYGQAGSVRVDGYDVRQFNLKELRRQIGYAPQATEFFYGTISQNLLMAKAGLSIRDVEKALEFMGILDEIRALPDGLETRLGDQRTSSVPEGLARKLSIARALVGAPPILLLDEPEQGLDRSGDGTVCALLERLSGRCTVIMCTHRPSYVRLAHTAIVLRDGAMEFMGKPKDAVAALMASSSGRGG